MRHTTSVLSMLALCSLAIGVAMAQVRSSTITGIVTDPSGAVVPNATVVVTNEQTNVALRSKTNGAGQYTVPYLEAGRYSVTVRQAGFQTYRKTDIVLETATTVRVDAALMTGTVTATIQVKASPVALQTENATVSGTVSTQIIDSIPNINRNPLFYSTLQAGVVADSQALEANTLGVGFTNRKALSAIHINGAQLGTDDVTLDGVSVQGSGWHEMVVMPDTDALQEVRTTTNNFTAETGDAQGVIAMTTKSGTNQYHGDLYYYLRNEALDASGMYNNLEDIKKPAYRLNQGGGSFGGPVIIPHVYNGKDKMFFFVDFMRLAHSEPDSIYATVPTAAQRMGDFSQTLVPGISGEPVPVNIYNPFLATPYQGSSTVVQRPIYPGAIVPTTGPGSIDPYGEKLMEAYPAPNHAPSDPFGDNNYFFNGTIPEYRNAFTSRLDFRTSNKNSFYATGGFSIGSVTPPNIWGPSSQFDYIGESGGSEISSIVRDNNPYASIGDVYTVSPTMFIDFHYGLTRVDSFSSYPNGNWTSSEYTEYGMPADVQNLISLHGAPMPVNYFGGIYTDLNNDQWNRKNEHQTNHDISGNLTKVAGKWTFKAGGEYRVWFSNWQDLEYGTPELYGDFNSSTQQFANINGSGSSLNTNPANNGINLASLLTGVAGFNVVPGTSVIPAVAAKYYALYSQNDWKATKKLTINLGLRWEVQPGPTERFNHTSDVNLTQSNPYAAGISLSNPLGGLGRIDFPGTNGQSRNMWNTQWNNFSPRVGVAYELTPNTVLRGGYGRMYIPSNSGFNANGLIYGELPFSGGAEAIPYGLNPNGVPVGQFQDPQNTLVTGGLGAVQSPYIYGNGEGSLAVDLFPVNYPNSYLDQWNFFVQHQFGKTWTMSLGYVGSHGSDQAWRNFQINGTWAIPNSTLMADQAAWIASNGTQDPAQVPVPNPLLALIGKAQGTIGNATIPAIDAQMPYLALLGQTIMGTAGTTNYNALQFSIQHPFSNGLTLLANYTWSKSTGLTGGPYSSNYVESQASAGAAGGGGSTGGVDYLNLNNNTGLQSYDIPQSVQVAAAYSLPFGTGRRFVPTNAVVRALASGWQLAPMVTLHSGEPWGPNCGGLDGRCNIVPGEPLYVPKNLQHWYNGSTSVTLPDGRTITPPAYTYLLYNPDRYTAPVVQFPNGTYAEEQYWYGQTPVLGNNLFTPGLANVDLSIQREIRLRENLRLVFEAAATNLFNRTNVLPSAINGGGGVVTLADPSTHTTVGMNSDISTGSLNAAFYDPREITLSLHLSF